MSLFLAVVFFFVYHDLSNAKSGIGNYDGAKDFIVGMVVEGSASRRIALELLVIFAIAILIRHRNDGWYRIKGPLGWIFLGFAAWALVSPIWAEDRVLTLTRVSVFGILCIAAIAITRHFSLREIIVWTFFTTGSYVVFGVAAEVVFGTFRPLVSGYRFAGTLHPNSQGINCALLLLSGVAVANLEKRRRALYWMCAFVGFVFLVLTASRTAFASALFSLALYSGLVCSWRTKIAVAYSLSVMCCALPLVLGNAFLPDLKSAAMLGRDDSSVGSLNGRTGVWGEISDYARRHPVLGYGYGGFWTQSHINEISEEEKWGIPNSHSAYLDYLLNLGLVGLAAYALLLFAGIKRALQFHRLSQNSVYAFCAAILVFCAMNGFLESITANPSLPMLLMFVLLIDLAVLDNRDASRFGPSSSGALC